MNGTTFSSHQEIKSFKYCSTSSKLAKSLPVVPFVKITDLGLVDVAKKEFIPL